MHRKSSDQQRPLILNTQTKKEKKLNQTINFLNFIEIVTNGVFFKGFFVIFLLIKIILFSCSHECVYFKFFGGHTPHKNKIVMRWSYVAREKKFFSFFFLFVLTMSAICLFISVRCWDDGFSLYFHWKKRKPQNWITITKNYRWGGRLTNFSESNHWRLA